MAPSYAVGRHRYVPTVVLHSETWMGRGWWHDSSTAAVHAMTGHSSILSRRDAIAESPAPCITEQIRYLSAGGNTWHDWGILGEFLGYFGEALVI
jgi:hypothetical protein